MQVDDLVVEVRDGDLARVGQIDARFLPGLLVNPMRNDVGSWQVVLPANHDLAETLRTPKAGLVVTGPAGVILSGPMTAAVFSQSAEDPVGEWTFTGVSDLIHVKDGQAFPSPAVADPGAQTKDNDVRTGARETLLHAYVNANIGPAAPSPWQIDTLTMGTDQGRGGSGTFSPRFQNLLELCQQITAGTELWFDVRQDGDSLVFVTGVGEDRTGEIRMDLDNQQLDQMETGLGAPQVTDVVVAGQGEGKNRTVLWRSSDPSEWGRRIRLFKDQRQTNDLTELQQAGDDELAAGGSTVHSLKVTPSDEVAGTYGVTWAVSDRVTVVLGDTEVPARVNGAVIAVVDTAVHLAVTIGDDTATDWESGVDQSISGLQSRVSNLERNTDAGEAAVNLSAYLLGGFSGSVLGWRDGQTVQIAGAVNGTVPSGSGVTEFLGPLPAEWRPTGLNRWGTAYASGYTGGAVVRPDGSGAFANRTAGAWAGIQFSIMFVRG